MKRVEGIIPYIPTPVDKAGNIMAEPIFSLVQHLATAGVSGVCVLGSVGEFAYLTIGQKKQLVSYAVKAGHSVGLDVIAGISGFSESQIVEEALLFSGLGADALVLMIEQYFPLFVEQLASMIRSVSQAVPDTEIILYSNPKYMHYSFPIRLFGLIDDCSNVDGYKDASGNTGFLLSIREQFGDRFRIFSASAHIPRFVFSIGGYGWMAGPACIIPKSSVRLFNLYKEGYFVEAMALQRKMWGINAAFTKFDLVSCIKGVLRIQGFDFGNPIPPLTPISDKDSEEIAKIAMSLEREI